MRGEVILGLVGRYCDNCCRWFRVKLFVKKCPVCGCGFRLARLARKVVKRY